MIFSKTFADDNYNKLIYDYKIKSITGEVLNFSDYQEKVISLLTLQVIVVLLSNMLIYKNFGSCTKIRVLL